MMLASGSLKKAPIIFTIILPVISTNVPLIMLLLALFNKLISSSNVGVLENKRFTT